MMAAVAQMAKISTGRGVRGWRRYAGRRLQGGAPPLRGQGGGADPVVDGGGASVAVVEVVLVLPSAVSPTAGIVSVTCGGARSVSVAAAVVAVAGAAGSAGFFAVSTSSSRRYPHRRIRDRIILCRQRRRLFGVAGFMILGFGREPASSAACEGESVAADWWK